MAININEDEPLYVQVDAHIKDRITAYVSESRLSKRTDTDTQRKLIEKALDEYMINNPITAN